MNCWMLSSFAIDPPLYNATDDRYKFVDADVRMLSSNSAAETAREEAELLDLRSYWSSDEGLDESTDGDKRLFPLWLTEHHLPGMSWQSWYDGRLPSPTFPDDHVDGLSRDLWNLRSSLLLDNDNDDDAYGNRTLLARLEERSLCAGYCSHTTSVSADDSCSTSRCLSCESSVSACSPTMTGIELAESTPASKFNSLDDDSGDVDSHQPLATTRARAWKRRRRRRRRRWSRQSSLGLTSRCITRDINFNCSVCRGSHILRSLLLHHSSRYGSYRSPYRTSAKFGRRSVSSGSGVDGRVISGHHRRGARGDASIPQQPRRTVATLMTGRRLSSAAGDDADTAAIRRRCLEDHCYFNWKRAPVIDCSKTSRCEDTQRGAWSAPVS